MEESTLRWPTDKKREEMEEVCSIGEVPHLTYGSYIFQPVATETFGSFSLSATNLLVTLELLLLVHARHADLLQYYQLCLDKATLQTRPETTVDDVSLFEHRHRHKDTVWTAKSAQLSLIARKVIFFSNRCQSLRNNGDSNLHHDCAFHVPKVIISENFIKISIMDFIGAKLDGSGGHNWIYKICSDG